MCLEIMAGREGEKRGVTLLPPDWSIQTLAALPLVVGRIQSFVYLKPSPVLFKEKFYYTHTYTHLSLVVSHPLLIPSFFFYYLVSV